MFGYYKVKYWDDCDNKEQFSQGIALGDDEKEVMENVTDFYGHDNVMEVSFKFPSDSAGSVIELEELEEVKDNGFFTTTM